MRLRKLVSLPWATALVLSFSSLSARGAVRKGETVVLVSFRNDAISSVPSHDRSPQVNSTMHDAFERFLNAHNISYKPRLRFTDVRMPLGISLALPSSKDVPALHAFPGVTQVEVVESGVWTPKPGNTRRNNDSPKHRFALRHVSLARADPSKSAAPALGPLSLGQKDGWGPHLMVRADKLHNEGILGAGVTIGIIDTGVDASHPAFGNCYGEPDCRIVGGYAFVADDNSLTLSPDPRPTCDGGCGIRCAWGHGSHTAGVIAAIDSQRNFTGMAPGAKLSPYRIAGCTGISSPDVVAAALVKAYHDGVDVISMSWSFHSGWAQTFTSRIVSSIVDLGLPVVLSEGNGGASGLFKPKSPSVAEGAISVASVQNRLFPGFTFRIKSGTQSISSRYLSVNPLNVSGLAQASLPIVATSKQINNATDGCEPLPSTSSNLTSHIVLVARSQSCGILQQINNVQDRGGRYIMLYNDNDFTSQPAYPDEDAQRFPGVQAVMITNEDGVRIAKLLASGQTVMADFSSPTPAIIENIATASMPSVFSEYGPSWTAAGMPAVAGVGGEVFSTWPVSAGSYAVLDGTSFSCPMIAGAVALYQSVKGKTESPQEIWSVFATTATPTRANSTSQVLDTVAHQGGGLLNAYKAVKSTSRVWPGRLLLNDTHSFSGSQNLTIRNIGTVTQVYSLAHQPAGTVYGRDADGTWSGGPLIPVDRDQASVHFNSDHVTVVPGQSVDIQITFTPPSIDAHRMGVYSGYIALRSDQGDLGSLTVPYMGVAADLARAPMLDLTTAEEDNSEISTQLNDVKTGAAMGPDASKNVFDLTRFDQQPQLQWNLLAGSPRADVFVVNASTTFVPTYRQSDINRAKDHGPSATSSQDEQCAVIPSADVVAVAETRNFLDRSTALYTKIAANWTDSTTATVRTVPDGPVRVLLQVLRPNADSSNPCSYETYLSNPFTVKNSQ